MPSRTITGTLPNHPATPIRIRLMESFILGDGVYLPADWETETDADDATYSLEIDVPETGTAEYRAYLGAQRFPFHLGAGDTTSMEIILASEATAMSVDDVQELITSMAADIDASEAAFAAEIQADVDALAADLALRVPLAAFSWLDDNAAFFLAPEAMTLGTPSESGTGTLAYAKALAVAQTTFNSTTLPVTLATGDVLRVTASGVNGYKALTLRRSA